MLKNAFYAMDKDQDGTLSLEELESGLHHLDFFTIDEEDNNENTFKSIIEKCDLDGDGRIDYLEFIQAAIDHHALLNEANLKSIFDIFDQDGSGTIDTNEMKQMFSQKPGMESDEE